MKNRIMYRSFLLLTILQTISLTGQVKPILQPNQNESLYVGSNNSNEDFIRVVRNPSNPNESNQINGWINFRLDNLYYDNTLSPNKSVMLVLTRGQNLPDQSVRKIAIIPQENPSINSGLKYAINNDVYYVVNSLPYATNDYQIITFSYKSINPDGSLGETVKSDKALAIKVTLKNGELQALDSIPYKALSSLGVLDEDKKLTEEYNSLAAFVLPPVQLYKQGNLWAINNPSPGVWADGEINNYVQFQERNIFYQKDDKVKTGEECLFNRCAGILQTFVKVDVYGSFEKSKEVTNIVENILAVIPDNQKEKVVKEYGKKYVGLGKRYQLNPKKFYDEYILDNFAKPYLLFIDDSETIASGATKMGNSEAVRKGEVILDKEGFRHISYLENGSSDTIGIIIDLSHSDIKDKMLEGSTLSIIPASNTNWWYDKTSNKFTGFRNLFQLNKSLKWKAYLTLDVSEAKSFKDLPLVSPTYNNYYPLNSKNEWYGDRFFGNYAELMAKSKVLYKLNEKQGSSSHHEIVEIIGQQNLGTSTSTSTIDTDYKAYQQSLSYLGQFVNNSSQGLASFIKEFRFFDSNSSITVNQANIKRLGISPVIMKNYLDDNGNFTLLKNDYQVSKEENYEAGQKTQILTNGESTLLTLSTIGDYRIAELPSVGNGHNKLYAFYNDFFSENTESYSYAIKGFDHTEPNYDGTFKIISLALSNNYDYLPSPSALERVMYLLGPEGGQFELERTSFKDAGYWTISSTIEEWVKLETIASAVGPDASEKFALILVDDDIETDFEAYSYNEKLLKANMVNTPVGTFSGYSIFSLRVKDTNGKEREVPALALISEHNFGNTASKSASLKEIPVELLHKAGLYQSPSILTDLDKKRDSLFAFFSHIGDLKSSPIAATTTGKTTIPGLLDYQQYYLKGVQKIPLLDEEMYNFQNKQLLDTLPAKNYLEYISHQPNRYLDFLRRFIINKDSLFELGDIALYLYKVGNKDITTNDLTASSVQELYGGSDYPNLYKINLGSNAGTAFKIIYKQSDFKFKTEADTIAMVNKITDKNTPWLDSYGQIFEEEIWKNTKADEVGDTYKLGVYIQVEDTTNFGIRYTADKRKLSKVIYPYRANFNSTEINKLKDRFKKAQLVDSIYLLRPSKEKKIMMKGNDANFKLTRAQELRCESCTTTAPNNQPFFYKHGGGSTDKEFIANQSPAGMYLDPEDFNLNPDNYNYASSLMFYPSVDNFGITDFDPGLVNLPFDLTTVQKKRDNSSTYAAQIYKGTLRDEANSSFYYVSSIGNEHFPATLSVNKTGSKPFELTTKNITFKEVEFLNRENFDFTNFKLGFKMQTQFLTSPNSVNPYDIISRKRYPSNNEPISVNTIVPPNYFNQITNKDKVLELKGVNVNAPDKKNIMEFDVPTAQQVKADLSLLEKWIPIKFNAYDEYKFKDENSSKDMFVMVSDTKWDEWGELSIDTLYRTKADEDAIFMTSYTVGGKSKPVLLIRKDFSNKGRQFLADDFPFEELTETGLIEADTFYLTLFDLALNIIPKKDFGDKEIEQPNHLFATQEKPSGWEIPYVSGKKLIDSLRLEKLDFMQANSVPYRKVGGDTTLFHRVSFGKLIPKKINSDAPATISFAIKHKDAEIPTDWIDSVQYVKDKSKVISHYDFSSKNGVGGPFFEPNKEFIYRNMTYRTQSEADGTLTDGYFMVHNADAAALFGRMNYGPLALNSDYSSDLPLEVYIANVENISFVGGNTSKGYTIGDFGGFFSSFHRQKKTNSKRFDFQSSMNRDADSPTGDISRIFRLQFGVLSDEEKPYLTLSPSDDFFVNLKGEFQENKLWYLEDDDNDTLLIHLSSGAQNNSTMPTIRYNQFFGLSEADFKSKYKGPNDTTTIHKKVTNQEGTVDISYASIGETRILRFAINMKDIKTVFENKNRETLSKMLENKAYISLLDDNAREIYPLVEKLLGGANNTNLTVSLRYKNYTSMMNFNKDEKALKHPYFMEFGNKLASYETYTQNDFETIGSDYPISETSSSKTEDLYLLYSGSQLVTANQASSLQSLHKVQEKFLNNKVIQKGKTNLAYLYLDKNKSSDDKLNPVPITYPQSGKKQIATLSSIYFVLSPKKLGEEIMGLIKPLETREFSESEMKLGEFLPKDTIVYKKVAIKTDGGKIHMDTLILDVDYPVLAQSNIFRRTVDNNLYGYLVESDLAGKGTVGQSFSLPMMNTSDEKNDISNLNGGTVLSPVALSSFYQKNPIKFKVHTEITSNQDIIELDMDAIIGDIPANGDGLEFKYFKLTTNKNNKINTLNDSDADSTWVMLTSKKYDSIVSPFNIDTTNTQSTNTSNVKMVDITEINNPDATSFKALMVKVPFKNEATSTTYLLEASEYDYFEKVNLIQNETGDGSQMYIYIWDKDKRLYLQRDDLEDIAGEKYYRLNPPYYIEKNF